MGRCDPETKRMQRLALHSSLGCLHTCITDTIVVGAGLHNSLVCSETDVQRKRIINNFLSGVLKQRDAARNHDEHDSDRRSHTRERGTPRL